MCASLTAGLGGRDVSGISLGGGASSSTSSSGNSERKGPSSARAGEFGRLPGIGSKVVPLDGAVCTIASLVSQLSKPSEWETLSTDCESEYMLLESRLNDGRLIKVVREVTGCTTCRSDSRNDLRECDDREEKVGEGSAAARGGVGCVDSIRYRFLGGELRISDMTESRGPETVTARAFGARRCQKGEV